MRLVPVPPPLELPGREAADVDVVLVEARVFAVVRELDLELQLALRYRQVADRARGTDSWAAPCPIRASVRELSGFQYFTDLRAHKLLVHLAGSPTVVPARAGRPSQMPSGRTPVASDQQGPREGNYMIRHDTARV